MAGSADASGPPDDGTQQATMEVEVEVAAVEGPAGGDGEQASKRSRLEEDGGGTFVSMIKGYLCACRRCLDGWMYRHACSFHTPPPTARPASGAAVAAGAFKSEASALRPDDAPMNPFYHEQKVMHGSSSSIPWPQEERQQEQGEEDGSGSGDGGGRVGAADGGGNQRASTYRGGCALKRGVD